VANPTLRFLQSLLGCTIEGLSKGRILVRLTRIDPSDHAREFSFVLDVSSTLFLGVFSSWMML
jgi:kinetochore protein Spc25